MCTLAFAWYGFHAAQRLCIAKFAIKSGAVLSCCCLQSQPLYHKAYAISTDVISQTQSTGIYKATVPRVYSTISPVADPVLHKIQSTETYKVILDQFQPISA